MIDGNELAGWDSFWFMVGSSAAALIGLQFVVLTLLTERAPQRRCGNRSRILTPTIVHFGVTFLVSAILLPSWQTMGTPLALLGVIGFCGIAYEGIITLHMQRQQAYHPELEDWLFHVVLPLAAYAVLAWSPFAGPSHLHEVLFGFGSASVLLLFVGIHNAWDNVAHFVFVHNNRRLQDENAGMADNARKWYRFLSFLALNHWYQSC